MDAGGAEHSSDDGDRLYVNHEGHAELQMGELAVRTWEFTDLSVVELANNATQLGWRRVACMCGLSR